MFVIAFTGHRPKDLVNYGYPDLAATLDLVLQDLPIHAFVTGGALGVDTWAAEYAIRHDIPLHIILPGPWANFSTDHNHCADSVTYLSNDPHYNVSLFQKRNIAMVDAANTVFAVWNGKRYGGTWNCIVYANNRKPIWNLFSGRMIPVTI